MKIQLRNLVQRSSAFAVLALNLFIIQPTKAGIFTNTGWMTTGRVYHTATLLANGKVLVAGGYPYMGSISYLRSVELYDPTTRTWTLTGAMTTARSSHTATLMPNGKVLVAGGYGNSGYLSSAELYDPTTGSWTNTGALTAVRAYHTATLLPNGKVLVAGGYTNFNGVHYLSSAELYDPTTGTWTNTGTMTTARYEHTATLLPNGKVLVTGGHGNSGYLSSAELYDPTTGTWTNTGTMTTARDSHTATLLPNGKVLVAGGGGNGGNSISTAELYDPATGTWMATGAMTTIRVGHTATLLPNGTALVAGGNSTSGSIALSGAELYNPATGTWTATGEMITGCSQHTATLLPNEMVLLTGGYGNAGSILSGAELYDWSTWTITTTQSPNNAGFTSGGGGYTNGASVNVTATAAPGYHFVGWTESGNTVSDLSDYRFVIYDDRVLVADFAANSFLLVGGAYNGLFYDETNGVAPQSSGFFSIATSAKGTFSGSLQVGGHRFSISGQFDINGKASKTITRRNMTSLTVELQLDFSPDSDQITGTVGDGTWTAQLAGYRAVFNSKTNPAPQAGKFTLLIPGSNDSATQPGGDGFGAVTVDGSGNVKFAGTLGDGTKVSQRALLSKQGEWPFYASLYSGNGVILGWLAFTNAPNNDIEGTVDWFKLPQLGAKLYPSGFSGQMEAAGSIYVQPSSGTPALNFSDGQLWLDDGNLVTGFTNQIVLAPSNKATCATNKLSLSIVPSTGLFKGSVPNPVTGKAISVNGAVLQKRNFGAGLFLGTNQSGSVYFGP